MAEDNTINQMVGKGILSKLGYSCDIADNGRRAIDMMRQTPYDVILMDLPGPTSAQAALVR